VLRHEVAVLRRLTPPGPRISMTTSRLVLREGPGLRLVCLPFAAGSPHSFRALARSLPADGAVVAGGHRDLPGLEPSTNGIVAHYLTALGSDLHGRGICSGMAWAPLSPIGWSGRWAQPGRAASRSFCRRRPTSFPTGADRLPDPRHDGARGRETVQSRARAAGRRHWRERHRRGAGASHVHLLAPRRYRACPGPFRQRSTAFLKDPALVRA
jgi:hypothetical protein